MFQKTAAQSASKRIRRITGLLPTAIQDPTGPVVGVSPRVPDMPEEGSMKHETKIPFQSPDGREGAPSSPEYR